MKRIIAALTVFLLFLQVAQAQEFVEEQAAAVQSFPRNEIGLSATLGTDVQLIAVQGSTLLSIVSTLLTNETFIIIPILVPLSLEYNFWATDRLAFGISLNADTVSALPYALLSKISIMPDVKYRLLCSDGFSMYSKAAVGYKCMYLGVQEDGKMKYTEILTPIRSEMQAEIDANPFRITRFATNVLVSPVAWQISPLCFEVNTAAKGLSFYLELGLGVQGALNLGFKKMF